MLDSIPSFMLTMPSPQPENTPVNVFETPVTIQEYIFASTAHLATNPGASVPRLPDCNHRASRDEDESGDNDYLCRACEKQLLACRLWYHARKAAGQSLREPLLKPAESNASIRATLEVLGLPVGSNRGLGIDRLRNTATNGSNSSRPLDAFDNASSVVIPNEPARKPASFSKKVTSLIQQVSRTAIRMVTQFELTRDRRRGRRSTYSGKRAISAPRTRGISSDFTGTVVAATGAGSVGALWQHSLFGRSRGAAQSNDASAPPLELSGSARWKAS